MELLSVWAPAPLCRGDACAETVAPNLLILFEAAVWAPDPEMPISSETRGQPEGHHGQRHVRDHESACRGMLTTRSSRRPDRHVRQPDSTRIGPDHQKPKVRFPAAAAPTISLLLLADDGHDPPGPKRFTEKVSYITTRWLQGGDPGPRASSLGRAPTRSSHMAVMDFEPESKRMRIIAINRLLGEGRPDNCGFRASEGEKIMRTNRPRSKSSISSG